ncbi:MAG TPA: hypothetical protein DIU35_15035 [Candidatus Latescibacteria bacterium]|nr:hypothetical protein [Candidatus Latescibacterota bacterium]|tara:strand:+ start:224 stop:1759 length:1536 start_codon:yes stop_codon:yes gene_type:complete
MDFDEALKRIWPEVRKRHLYPELPHPTILDEMSEVGVLMRNKRINLNQDLCESLSEHLPAEHVLEGLLDHGVAHHTVCPWDFDTYLGLYAALKPELLDGDLVKQVVDFFMDVVVDTHCVKERASVLPDLYRVMDSAGVRNIMKGLYQEIWGVDLGVSPDPDVVSRLSRIPYLDRTRWTEAIRSFARVVGPLVEQAGESQAASGSGLLGEHNMQQYAEDEVAKGLKEFSNRGFHAFRAMVEDFRQELEEAGQLPEVEMGRGKGIPKDADLLYYMQKSRSYNLPIRTIPMEKVGGLHPHSHSPWEVGKPVQDIDIWTSFGRILPGISQVWDRREGETHGQGEGRPDCLVVIDSSGSMTNPCEDQSYAVLGAGCAADAYLNQRKKVAVYNFSDAPSGSRQIQSFTRDRRKIYTALCRYFGGGTALHLPDLKAFGNNPCDIFIITDMQITNLRAVTDYLLETGSRVTAVHVGHTREAKQFRSAVSESQSICVYPVEKPEDIPKIVLAEVDSRLVA